MITAMGVIIKYLVVNSYVSGGETTYLSERYTLLSELLILQAPHWS